MRHFRHDWLTTFYFSTPIKRECKTCERKEINVWGYWDKVKTKRDEELYALL